MDGPVHWQFSGLGALSESCLLKLVRGPRHRTKWISEIPSRNTSVLLRIGLSEDRGSRVTFQVISQRSQRPRCCGNVSEAFDQFIVNRRVKIAQRLNVSDRSLCPF